MDEPINISALNQYAYCPRRCALIYLEGEFTQNIHTARGNAEHERVDRVAHETKASGARVEFALPVWSDRLGLIGKCDVVEFHPDGTIYPVEYKHGPRRRWINDDLQVCAQAMCIEEITEKPIGLGAIYHVASRHRRDVEMTTELRKSVEETVLAIRRMLESGCLPAPVNDKRCKECSLKDTCQPEAIAATRMFRKLRASLFIED